MFEIVAKVEVEGRGILGGFEDGVGVLIGAAVLALPVRRESMVTDAEVARCWH